MLVEKHLYLHCLDCDLSYHIHLYKCPMCTVLLKFSKVSKLYKTKSRPSINKSANLYLDMKLIRLSFGKSENPCLQLVHLLRQIGELDQRLILK